MAMAPETWAARGRIDGAIRAQNELTAPRTQSNPTRRALDAAVEMRRDYHEAPPTADAVCVYTAAYEAAYQSQWLRGGGS